MTTTAAPPHLDPRVRAWWDLPAQPAAAAILGGAVARAEVSHAWAFVGPPGVGQERAARRLLAALNCPVSEVRGAACGGCDVCARALRGTHPAYAEFAPVGAFHRVADVEGWLHAAFTTTAEGPWKVLRVVDADRLNEQASNRFLKGLEEPPDRTVWILDVADPDAGTRRRPGPQTLPDTILSRCRVVRFNPWDAATLEAEAVRLGLADPGDRDLAVRVAMGSPAILARLAEEIAGRRGLDDFRTHRALLHRVRVDGPGEALVAAAELESEVRRRAAALRARAREEAERLAERYGTTPPKAVTKQLEERYSRMERELRVSTAQAALDGLVSWCRDALLLGGGAQSDAVLNIDAVAELRDDVAALAPAVFLEAADLAFGAREALELNVAVGLAIEALGLSLHDLTRPRGAS